MKQNKNESLGKEGKVSPVRVSFLLILLSKSY